EALSMDVKHRDDLFRNYVQLYESKLDTSEEKQQIIDDLKSVASAYLNLSHIDPLCRFGIIRFYKVAENSLKILKSSSLSALLNAFQTLETISVNLFLCPWKKEFKKIKTYTGPFVYYVKSTLCEEDISYILSYMGYSQEQETVFELKGPVNTSQVKMVSFDLFLAKLECELQLEIFSQVKDKGCSELNVLTERKNSKEDMRGCIDVLKRHMEHMEEVSLSISRLPPHKSGSERAHKSYTKQKVSKPSKSVDLYENHWENKSKPPLVTSVSLRNKPLYVDTSEDIKDEIIRPTPSLLTISSSPHGGSEDFLSISPNDAVRTNITYSSYIPCLEELDLYTDPDSKSTQYPKRQEPTKTDVCGVKNDVYHKRMFTKETCYMCEISICEMKMCNQCHADHVYECQQEYIKVLKQSSSAVKTPVLQNDSYSSGPTLREKAQYISQSQSQERSSALSTKTKASTSLRCGFCNKVGAANTCVNCSKVSCDMCKSSYCSDHCCRKNETHKFMPNSQLNFKSNRVSHQVYR
uniref:Spermatosis associated 2 n=1 Tax=Latimeria chalumnae TaxID=7897 RepID=H3BDV2_LATCH